MGRKALRRDNQYSTFAHTHEPKPLNHLTVVPHPVSPLRFKRLWDPDPGL